MASIELDDASVEFVVYQGSARSLRKSLLHSGSSGTIKHDDHHRIVVKALDAVTLRLEEGDRVALIGGNGAGKTTLLRTIAGIYEPTSGRLRVEGRVTPLFDLSLGLDMDATGYDNIRLQAAFFGLSRRTTEERIEDIAAFTELGHHLSLPVRTYSAGMRLRLAYATATATDAEILLMDEWLAVGDSHFLQKAQRRAERFVRQARILVVASHIEGVLLGLCNKAVLLDRGRIVAAGRIDDVLNRYAGRAPAEAVAV